MQYFLSILLTFCFSSLAFADTLAERFVFEAKESVNNIVRYDGRYISTGNLG